MCGIAGFVGQGNKNDLVKMISAVKYRGPDDQGFFMHDDVGLAHARLSIIDLSMAGHQPMSNNDQTIWLVFNGEIYNFQELKADLCKKYRFKSTSDTEVIIHLYEEYGGNCFRKLNGMFAIALYDFREHKLILARDRMGEKPLYWAIFNSTLVFGSELKVLANHILFKKELDLQSLNKYLFLDYVPTPHSIFKNVFKLEPATYLVWFEQKIQKKTFWQMDFTEHNMGQSKTIDELDNILNESVRSRLVADVPVGIFLSGGLDSSTIAYYATKNSNKKIKTFSIGFREQSFDESRYAKQVSEFLGTEHHSEILEQRDVLNLITEVIKLIDEPLADASIIPTYLLSRYTKKFITVALGGDGADELFAGYPTFQAEKFVDFYSKIPLFLRKLIEKGIYLLPVSMSNFSFDFKLKTFISGLYGDKNYIHQRWLGSFGKQEIKELFKKEVWHKLSSENEFEEVNRYRQEVIGTEEAKLLFVYMRMYLMDQVLVKVDRASMSASLEVRVPFLDYMLVDFVSSIPFSLKCHGFTTKYILKKLMENKLPHNIVNRQKKGFGIPISGWLRKELKLFCDDTLSERNINEDGLFEYEYIDRLKNDHFEGKKDNRKLLWNLLIFQHWKKNWLS